MSLLLNSLEQVARRSRRWRKSLASSLAGGILGTLAAGFVLPVCGADDREPAMPPVAEAPPRTAIVGETLNGWYFAPKELKDSYEAALRHLSTLQQQVDRGDYDAGDATRTLEDLQQRLKSLRTKLNESRVFVKGAEIHEQTETLEFELGPDRLLAITANEVRVVGSDGPRVKVELKKQVLSPDGKPVDEQLRSIAARHRRGRAEFAGDNDATWEAREAEFLTKEGTKLTPEQLVSRKKFVDSIRRSYAVHRDLLDKEVDQITVDGLDYESNRVVSLNVKSQDGDGRFGSVRQRYAQLTVHVPACRSVTIRGARRGLRVEGLAADLILTSSDSTDSNTRGSFVVTNLRGNLVCRDFPLGAVRNVQGNVSIESTTELGFEGAGTMHHDDLRTLALGRPVSVELTDITGDLRARYGRVALRVQNVGGQIDVENRFGATTLVADRAFSEGAHRVYSLSGNILAELSATAWKSTPVLAVTSHGGARTNVDRESFDDFHLEGEDKTDDSRGSFHGFRTKIEGEERFAVFGLIDRFAAIASGAPRAAGLDLFSRGGRVDALRK